MKIFQQLIALLIFSSPVFAAPQQSCKILDPDLAQGTYRGSCKNGLADGYGEVSGISTYRGNFLAGKKHGQGIKVMPNGDRYEGGFSDDYRNGKGIYVWGDKTQWAGDRYEGEYQRDLRHGFGVFQWASGDKYEGAWENDLRMGPSVLEQRRAQAAEIAAKTLRVGAQFCGEEKWDSVNIQLIRGTIESIKNKLVQVRIVEVEGGFVTYQGNKLTVGDALSGEATHWQPCEQD